MSSRVPGPGGGSMAHPVPAGGRAAAWTGGFSLIELIMVMAVLGALAAVGGMFIVEPFRASADMTRRAALVDQADLALDRIRREVRAALPNSVRVDTDGTLFAVELVSTRAGGRYRRLPPGDTLIRAQAQDTFEALGGLPGIAEVADNTGSAGAACATGAGWCMSIYNTGQPGFDVYDGDNLAVLIDADDSGPHTLEYRAAAPPAFRAHSPRQRFFVIDTAVSYVCDPGAGTLRRYADYGLGNPQPLPPGGTGALVASDVQACRFAYQAGSATRRGLLQMRLELAAGGETVTLFAQAHVVNAP